MADDRHNNAAHTPGEPEDEHTHDPVPFPIDEPPIEDEDTQPRAAVIPPGEAPDTADLPLADTPVVTPQPQYPPLDEQTARLMADPNDWASGRAPRYPADEEDDTSPRGRPLLMITVMLGTACLCMAMIGLSGFAGYRDGLATNDARVTQTLATGIAQQYATGAADLQAGYAELAEARFSWIVETIQAPTEYALDSPVQLAVARTIAAFTPTPQPTLTPSATPSPEATDIPEATSTPDAQPAQTTSTTPDSLQDPAYFYEQAATAYRLARYEQVIEWLDALNTLAPAYQPEAPNAKPVRDMLLDALNKQGRIYLLGLNEDGEDKLARGVYLIYRADDLGAVEPDWMLGQAIFVERYINARNYVNGGYYETAIPVLEQLCTENCEWSYAGVSVRDLLERARASAS